MQPPATMTAEGPASSFCMGSIATGSPGAALIILGQIAHPRALDRHSHRTLREQVEADYENGTFAKRSEPGDIVRNCGVLSARSPGAALMLRGVSARPDVEVQRVANRFVQQQAEQDRTHTGGVQLSPLAP